MMKDGIEEPRTKGTPQGSPLSPLLSNIVLDELDKELEKRGHRFVRYADDFQIYVGSQRTAERVMDSISRFIEKKLRLKVNEEKSTIGRPWECTLLGYSFTRNKEVKVKVSKESLRRLRNKVREKLRQGRGRNLSRFINEDLNPLLRGWINYFKYSEVKGFAAELDGWIRRHLRKIKWRQWKRSWTRRTQLMVLGLSEERAVMSAFNQRGPWWNSGASHMNLAFPKSYFDRIGLVSLQDVHRHHHLFITSLNRRDT
jgi:RNA-directed DNA polymerase